MWYPNATAGRCASESTFVTRFSAVCGGSVRSGVGGTSARSIPPKYCSTHSIAWSASMSPVTTRTALFGA